MPPQFDDITNSVEDVWDRAGFGEDKKLKSTFKTPPVYGGAITVSEEIKGVGDFSKGFAAKISAKWKHACGFSVNKFDNDLKKGTVLETSFDKFGVPGLSAACNMKTTYGDKGKTVYPLEVKYENDVAACSVASTAPAFKDVTASLTLATEGLMVGTALECSAGNVKDYPIKLSYDAGDYTCAVGAKNELKCFGLYGKYKATSELTLASYFQIPDKTSEMILCGVYKLGGDFKTTLAGKYSEKNAKKTLECSAVAKPLKGVDTGVSLALPIGNFGAYKYGFSFTLG